jgi:dTDP-4-dehydrorhamnose reductase
MSRILITGCSGMLGATLYYTLSKKHRVYCSGNSSVNFLENYIPFDLTNPSYKKLISWSKPEIIVHCAALTDANYCDKNLKEAFEINSFSLNKLIKYTKKDVKIIYISSDAVFSPKAINSSEFTITSPTSVYGKSKELGEFILLNSKRVITIIRTTIVGINVNRNRNRMGLVDWIIGSVKNNNNISLYCDVVFNPISIWDLSDEIEFIIENKINDKILHVSGSESIDKYMFGIELLNLLNLDTNCINSSLLFDEENVEKKSFDQTINCQYYQEKYNRRLPSIENTLLSIKKHYYEFQNRK